MTSLAMPVTRRPFANAWLSAILATVGFVAVVAGATALVGIVAGGVPHGAYRARAVRLITGSAVGEFTAVAFLVLFLRARGRALADVGLRRGASLVGWLVAAAVAALAVSLVLEGALRGKVPIAEISAFHLYTSLAAGVAAGICEEVVFRGYVMSVLAEAGAGVVQQLLATSVLFGLAHAPWSHLAGGINPVELVAAVANTAVFGLLYGAVFLVSRRTLLPAIAAHGITDMLIEPWLVLSALAG